MWKALAMAFVYATVMGSSIVRAETITFDDQSVGAAPTGFSVALTGRGGSPKWEVQKAPNGEAGNVVVQTSAEAADYRFPLLVYDKAIAVDLDLSVKFRAIRGSIDQAAGLVWR